MAVQQHEYQQTEQQQNQSLLFDSLYCEEEQWEEEAVGEVVVLWQERDRRSCINGGTNPFLPLLLLEQDLFWEDEELTSLFSKEQQIHLNLIYTNNDDTDSALILARREAVEWMLRVIAFYGFTALTAILAINYLDRFLSSLHFQRDKPWMIQLAAVTCLSLAAKVEETQVPLLLDLQVEDTKYMFEAKTIQRMELLVLSALKWRMNPVTPLSFLDHIVRRLGLKTHLRWEFLRRCERLLVTVVADSRSVGYVPSVLATATMLNVIRQVEPWTALEYQNQLLGILKISKERVTDCYQLITELSNNSTNNGQQNNPYKRKCQQIPACPSGVTDLAFSSDGSNGSWALGPSLSSSPQPLFKKSRAQLEQQQQQMLAPSLNRVFVGSPC